MKNYYEVLGISPSAGADDIKTAYRKLAKESHPDLHPDDRAAEERFKEIDEAWKTLGNAGKRKAYDAKLSGEKQTANRPTGSAPVGKVNMDDLMAGFDNFFSDDKLRKSKVKAASKGPVDADEMFERFMGIRKK